MYCHWQCCGLADVQASRSVLKTLPVFTESALAFSRGLLAILVNLGQGNRIDGGSFDGLRLGIMN